MQSHREKLKRRLNSRKFWEEVLSCTQESLDCLKEKRGNRDGEVRREIDEAVWWLEMYGDLVTDILNGDEKLFQGLVVSVGAKPDFSSISKFKALLSSYEEL